MTNLEAQPELVSPQPIAMGGGASVLQTVTLNCGCEGGAPFQFTNQDRLPETREATATLTTGLQLRFSALEDVLRESCSGTVLAAGLDRCSELSSVHTTLYDAFQGDALRLKGDKDVGVGRVNPFTRAALDVDGVPMVEAIIAGSVDRGRLLGLMRATYTSEWHAANPSCLDLVLFDVACVVTVSANVPAYALLFTHSAFSINGKLKSDGECAEDVKAALRFARNTDAVVVVAEAPGNARLRELLAPGQIGFTVSNDADPLNVVAISGLGNVRFEQNVTRDFRDMLREAAPHPSWHTRLVAAMWTFNGVRGVTVGVHWHHIADVYAYATCIAGVLQHAIRSFGAEIAVCAGDFNFQSKAELKRVQVILRGFRVRAHPVDAADDPLITTRKTRSPFQCQPLKAGVEHASPRLVEWRLSSYHPDTGGVVTGPSTSTPNPGWALDHGGLVLATTVGG